MSRTEERIIDELKYLDHQQDNWNGIPCSMKEYDEKMKTISKRKAELWAELREISKPIVQDAKTSLCAVNGIGQHVTDYANVSTRTFYGRTIVSPWALFRHTIVFNHIIKNHLNFSR